MENHSVCEIDIWNMTIYNTLRKGKVEGAEENAKRDAYANELFQKAVRIGMELNTKYHTPEEILKKD